MRNLIPKSGQIYYIVFDRHIGARKNWWHYVLDKKFMHCFLLFDAYEGKTLIINPSLWGIYNFIKNVPIKDCIDWHLKSGVTSILKYKVKIKKREKFKFRGIYTCVSFIKNVLNIRGMSLSPKRLHKYLLKNGATEINLPT